jgi:Big-like domain-containing protein
MALETHGTLDGTDLGVVTSPLVLDNLTVGSHTLVLYTFDTTTLVASDPVVFTWTVDQPPPPAGGNGVYTKTVILPNANGPDQILVRATDLQSVPQTTVVVRNVSVAGATGPAVAITAPSNGQNIFDPNLIVQANVTDNTGVITTVQCTIDGSSFTDMTQTAPDFYEATITLPQANVGDIFQISVVATDDDTNQSVDSVVIVIQVTTQPPTQPSGGIIGPSTIQALRKPAKFELMIFDHAGNLVGIPQTMPSWGRYLNAAGYMNAAIELHDSMAKKDKINPDVHDWGIFRDGIKIEGGIITDAAVDTDERMLNITGATWLGYLTNRFMDFDPSKIMNAVFCTPGSLNVSKTNVVSLTYTNVDLFDIVRSLLDYILGVTNSIPITYDSHDSGIIIPVANFDASDESDTLSRLTDLSTQAPGFDFELSPDCHLTMYTPQKGVNIADFSLDLERNVFAINGYENSGIKATRVFATGEGTGSGSAIALAQNTTLETSRRRKDMSQDIGTVFRRSQLNSSAKLLLSLASQEQIGFQVKILTEGLDVWSICGPGDSIRVQADLEYDILSGYYRILSMEGEPTNQGDEYVTFTFGPSPELTG